MSLLLGLKGVPLWHEIPATKHHLITQDSPLSRSGTVGKNSAIDFLNNSVAQSVDRGSGQNGKGKKGKNGKRKKLTDAEYEAQKKQEEEETQKRQALRAAAALINGTVQEEDPEDEWGRHK